MEILKKIGSQLVKYSEILLHSSEQFVKDTKVRMQIRSRESEIKKVHTKIGKHIYDIIDSDPGSDFLKDDTVSTKYSEIRSILDEIEALKEKLNQTESPKDPDSGN